jgi:hypothetical protein
MVKTCLIPLNIIHILLKLLILQLSVAASVHVTLYVQFYSVYLSSKLIGFCEHVVYEGHLKRNAQNAIPTE